MAALSSEPQSWNATFWKAHPAFRPLRAAAACFESYRDWPDVREWSDALGTLCPRADDGRLLRFVTQAPRARRARAVLVSSIYDVRIAQTLEVPSRARNWHDFLNMLCWATFPKSKWSLAVRQARAIRSWAVDGAASLPGRRPRERDALAMIDEGGAFAVGPDERPGGGTAAIVHAGRGTLRTAQRCIVFGHAIFEHLARSAPAPRATVIALSAPQASIGEPECVAYCDAWLSELLRDDAFPGDGAGMAGESIADAKF